MAKVTPKKQVKSSSRSSATKKTSTKKSVVSGGGRKKQGFLSSFGRNQWVAVGLLVIVIFGGIGLWRLLSSSAADYVDPSTPYTTALNSEQCNIRGRVYSNSRCYHQCQTGAGSEAFVNTYMYCASAVSRTLSSSTCASVNRQYLSDPGGCARQWKGTYNSRYTNDIRCINNSWTYVNASSSTGIDKCVSPTTTTTTPTTSSTGWVAPVSYAYGINYGFSTANPHYGVDVSASGGTNVRAVAAGTVNWKGNIGDGCGSALILRTKAPTGATVYVVYEHIIPSSGLSIGEGVAQGQFLGDVDGSAGYRPCWSGPHLHLGIQNVGGTVYSPANFARAGYFKDSAGNFMKPCSWLPGC